MDSVEEALGRAGEVTTAVVLSGTTDLGPVRTSSLESTTDGERGAASPRVVGPTADGPPAVPDDKAGIVVWLPWLWLPGVGIEAVLLPEGEGVRVSVCDVCSVGVVVGEGGGVVTAEKVSVSCQAKVLTSGPLVAPALGV